MNGIQMTCATQGGPLKFEGIWGNWDSNWRTCAGGFTGASIKLEPRQVICIRIKIRFKMEKTMHCCIQNFLYFK